MTTVVSNARDLTPEQRKAAEVLLGRSLAEDETVSVRAYAGHIIKPALVGPERDKMFREWMALIDETAARAKHVPESEIDDAINEAIRYVRSHPE